MTILFLNRSTKVISCEKNIISLLQLEKASTDFKIHIIVPQSANDDGAAFVRRLALRHGIVTNRNYLNIMILLYMVYHWYLVKLLF